MVHSPCETEKTQHTPSLTSARSAYTSKTFKLHNCVNQKSLITEPDKHFAVFVVLDGIILSEQLTSFLLQKSTLR